jgi:hypothetical protein
VLRVFGAVGAVEAGLGGANSADKISFGIGRVRSCSVLSLVHTRPVVGRANFDVGAKGKGR